MVNCQWRLSESLASKFNESYTVVLATFYKFECHIFGSFQSVGAEVLALHAARHIHCKHNVEAFNLHLLATQLALRTCKGDN